MFLSPSPELHASVDMNAEQNLVAAIDLNRHTGDSGEPPLPVCR